MSCTTPSSSLPPASPPPGGYNEPMNFRAHDDHQTGFGRVVLMMVEKGREGHLKSFHLNLHKKWAQGPRFGCPSFRLNGVCRSVGFQFCNIPRSFQPTWPDEWTAAVLLPLTRCPHGNDCDRHFHSPTSLPPPPAAFNAIFIRLWNGSQVPLCAWAFYSISSRAHSSCYKLPCLAGWSAFYLFPLQNEWEGVWEL